MSENSKIAKRRNVLRGITAGTVASTGVGAVSGSSSDGDRTPSERKRAELRAPFEDFEKARSFLLENTKRLRVELEKRGYIPSATPDELRMNHLATGHRKTPIQRESDLGDVRVKAVATDEFEFANVDTWVSYRNYLVTINVSIGSDVASALVFELDEDGENGRVEAHLWDSGDGIETKDVETADHGGCGVTDHTCTDQVCDDCCGWFDCTKEKTIIYDPDNSRQSFCHCIPTTSCCCEDGCGTLCAC